MKKYNILITGGAISNNEGAAAMTLATANLIQKYISDSNIKIITAYFDDCKKRSKGRGYETIPRQEIIQLCINRDFLKQFAHISEKNRILKEYRDADLIIDVSGDAITDDYGIANTLSTLKEFWFISLFKKPIIIFPQSIGPFKIQLTRSIAKFVFNRCKIVIPREKTTYNLLKNLGVNTLSPIIDDSAFLLKPISKKEIKNIMKKERIKKDKGKLLIGLSLSQSIARYSKDKTNKKYEEYTSKMVKIVDYLTEKKKANLVFIPHVGGEKNKTNDDRIMCNLIYSKARDKERIRIMKKKRYWPQEFKGVISKCDLFIGSRMHANIAALSTNVPTIAIAYSHKTYGIMERFKQQKYVCDIMNLSEKEIILQIEDALKNKKKIKKQLIKKNKSIEKNEKILGSIIKNALKNNE